ncbi:MAG: glycosyltransferase [Candidatus Methylomirabilales bacterium]
MLLWLEGLCLIGIGCYLVRLLLEALTTWWWVTRVGDPAPTSFPPLSVIKPVRGLDQEARENFLSFIETDYPGPVEVLFCVEEETDPVIPVIRTLIADHPGRAVRLIVAPRQNPRWLGKMANLVAGVRAARFDWLVFSDSDVRADRRFLQDLTAPLHEPRIGLTCGYPVHRGARNWVAALLALFVHEALPAAVLFFLSGGGKMAIGASMAIRRDVLDRIGGLEPLGEELADDAALGRAVSQAGYRVHLVRHPIPIIHARGSLTEWWQQMVRWLTTVRHTMPALYLALPILDSGIPLALGYWLLDTASGGGGKGLMLLATVMVSRVTSASLTNLAFAKDRALWSKLWLVLPLDLVKPCLFIHGLLAREVTWRGRRLRLTREGRAILLGPS